MSCFAGLGLLSDEAAAERQRNALARERQRAGYDDEVAVFSEEEDKEVINNSDSTILYEGEEEDN